MIVNKVAKNPNVIVSILSWTLKLVLMVLLIGVFPPVIILFVIMFIFDMCSKRNKRLKKQELYYDMMINERKAKSNKSVEKAGWMQ